MIKNRSTHTRLAAGRTTCHANHNRFFLLHLEALLKTHPSAQKQPHKDPGHNDQGPYAAKVQLGYLSAAALSLANLAVLASCCSRVVA